MTRFQAADDFASIRARMQELQRERAQRVSEKEPPGLARPHGYLFRRAVARASVDVSAVLSPTIQTWRPEGPPTVLALRTRIGSFRPNEGVGFRPWQPP